MNAEFQSWGKKKEHDSERASRGDAWGNHCITDSYGKLFLEVAEGKELVVGIGVFIVFAIAALDLAVMSASEKLDEHVSETKLIQRYFEECPLPGA